MRAAAAIVAIVGLLGTGCTSQRDPSSSLRPSAPAERSALGPVVLPDLSPMPAAVQAQLREGHLALTAAHDNPSVPPRELGEAYGLVGKLLMAAEYYDVAETSFRNAQALMPDDARWPYYLGHVFTDKGDPVNGVVFYETALRLNPNDALTLLRLGDAYLTQGRAEAAEPMFTRALTVQPDSAPALFGLGRVSLARSDYRRAVTYLEDALGRDPLASIIHYPLAMAYRGLGDVATAEAHLQQRGETNVRLADPLMQEVEGLLETVEAYEFRGNQALSRGDWADAAAQFRRGLALAPDAHTMYHQLGTALALAGDTRGAIDQFREAVKRDPSFAKARLSLGVLLEVSGRRQEAIDQLSAAVKYDPTFLEAHLRLAQVLRQAGRTDESLSHYESALTIDPLSSEARLEYATILVTRKRYREAREQLTEGVRLHPDQPEFAQALAGLPTSRR